MEIRPIGCPEMSVGIYRSTVRKIGQRLKCREAKEQATVNVAAQAYEEARKSESSDVLALMFCPKAVPVIPLSFFSVRYLKVDCASLEFSSDMIIVRCVVSS